MAATLPRGTLVAQGLLFALLAWLYGGDLVHAVRASSAPAAFLTALPNVGLALAGVAVVLGGVGALVAGAVTGRDAAWRGYRLAPIAGVVLLFVDFAVLSSVRSSVSAEQRVLLAVSALAEGASEHASHEAVPDEPRLLQSFVDDLQPVPLFAHGERVPKWTVDVRRGCAGPAADAQGKGPGTLVYCLAPDGRRAWITVVAVGKGERFGEPAILSIDEPWMAEVEPADARPPELPEADEPGPDDVWHAPTPGEPPDSGR